MGIIYECVSSSHIGSVCVRERRGGGREAEEEGESYTLISQGKSKKHGVGLKELGPH